MTHNAMLCLHKVAHKGSEARGYKYKCILSPVVPLDQVIHLVNFLLIIPKTESCVLSEVQVPTW